MTTRTATAKATAKAKTNAMGAMEERKGRKGRTHPSASYGLAMFKN
jgi:hypothetical protein